MPNNHLYKSARHLVSALHQFENSPLTSGARNLLKQLGVKVDRTPYPADAIDSSSESFRAQIRMDLDSPDQIRTLDILTKEVTFLCQILNEDICQEYEHGEAAKGIIFVAADIHDHESTEKTVRTLTKLLNSTYQTTPVIGIYRYGTQMALATVKHRINKRDPEKDVLENKNYGIYMDLNLRKIRRKDLGFLLGWQKVIESPSQNVDDIVSYIASIPNSFSYCQRLEKLRSLGEDIKPFKVYTEKMMVWPLLTEQKEKYLARTIDSETEKILQIARKFPNTVNSEHPAPIDSANDEDEDEEDSTNLIEDTTDSFPEENKESIAMLNEDMSNFRMKRKKKIKEFLSYISREMSRVSNLESCSTEAEKKEALQNIESQNNVSIEQLKSAHHKSISHANEIVRAKKNMTLSNLRLVIFIIMKYKYTGRGLPFWDIVQAGNAGLMKAVDKFDYRKGYKFSTYATGWIRQAITRSLADLARTIRIPVHMIETINKINRTVRQLQQEKSREPAHAELGTKLGMSADKVKYIQEISKEPVSMDQLLVENDDSTIGDFIENYDAIDPLDNILKEDLGHFINDVLDKTLTAREAEVIRKRFGIGMEHEHTLAEIGEEFNVTRERVRQIEAKAFRKLRHEKNSQKIKSYLTDNELTNKNLLKNTNQDSQHQF